MHTANISENMRRFFATLPGMPYTELRCSCGWRSRRYFYTEAQARERHARHVKESEK